MPASKDAPAPRKAFARHKGDGSC
ncbi:hypothetical protein RHECNPAF_1700043 [Rhizobium etli CNPAF512]|nr:hypothetical protein RHECNPAF_1700043 [Rhizobium etli CNPAF512]